MTVALVSCLYQDIYLICDATAVIDVVPYCVQGQVGWGFGQIGLTGGRGMKLKLDGLQKGLSQPRPLYNS